MSPERIEKTIIDVKVDIDRIADALERIADALEGKQHKHEGDTEFRWDRTSTRTRNALASYRMNNYTPKNFRDIPWPWTCEDLMFIGHNQLKKARNFGPLSSCEIAKLLGEKGFDNWLAT